MKGKEIIEQVLNDIPQSFEWLHVRPDGTQIVCEVALTRILAVISVFWISQVYPPEKIGRRNGASCYCY